MLGPAASKAELLDGLAQALEFPGLGRAATGTRSPTRSATCPGCRPGPKVVVWAGADALRAAQPAAYRTALEVLRDGAERSTVSGRPLTVLLAPAAGDA